MMPCFDMMRCTTHSGNDERTKYDAPKNDPFHNASMHNDKLMKILSNYNWFDSIKAKQNRARPAEWRYVFDK